MLKWTYGLRLKMKSSASGLGSLASRPWSNISIWFCSLTSHIRIVQFLCWSSSGDSPKCTLVTFLSENSLSKSASEIMRSPWSCLHPASIQPASSNLSASFVECALSMICSRDQRQDQRISHEISTSFCKSNFPAFAMAFARLINNNFLFLILICAFNFDTHHPSA